jgi:signal transduction histidine kinase
MERPDKFSLFQVTPAFVLLVRSHLLAAEKEARGMGLRNLRHRAEALGARLDITSRPGEGTTIGLEVPLS